MNHHTIRVKLLLLCSVYFYTNSIHPSTADAYLFHQLKPLSQVNSQPPFTSYRNNTSPYESADSDNSGNYPSRNPQSSNRAQNDQQQAPINFLNGGRNPSTIEEDENCPSECTCNTAQIADCSNRNLARVPSGFPKGIKRINLNRNNITELGPHAFQGLKHLQRIDLSNNNLVRVDSLAFAGGLQSLNSLILFSNKLSELPVNLFKDLNQLTLLLLNANSLQCIQKELFQPLSNLNLLSLYGNNIETLVNGTFDGLKNIKTIHLGKNPLICDCNLRWLADFLESNPIETSEARCEGPARNQNRKLAQLRKEKFKCEGNEQSKTNQIASQCSAGADSPANECPPGCSCNGATVDCSQASISDSKTTPNNNGMYELPDIPDDIPVYVTQMRINDQRIKRIRQTGIFRRLANAQKLDLGNNRIIDIEDNTINANSGAKPERVVFVLLENEHCSADGINSKRTQSDDPCLAAPRVNGPNYDSPCYNGGSCISGISSSRGANYNYSCVCPPGFAGPLCEVNIDDCVEHQCQNGAMCIDGINSYRCVCRDPTTSGEFCEQLNSYTTSSSANSIAPMALPIVASAKPAAQQLLFEPQSSSSVLSRSVSQPQPILARSADFYKTNENSLVDQQQQQSPSATSTCKRVTQRRFYDDGNGCQSVRMLKISECIGGCPNNTGGGNNNTLIFTKTNANGSSSPCCAPEKVKRRKIRMQCTDGASYVKTIDLIKKCTCDLFVEN